MNWLLDILKKIFGLGGDSTKTLPEPTPVKWEKGKSDTEVKEVQKKLINIGHEFSGGSDGKLGDYTEAAIEDFKEDNGIEEEGIGPKTLEAIDKAYDDLGIDQGLILKVGDDDDDFKDDDDPDNDTQVSDFQKKLIALGHDMPRFGADGGFGEESLLATKEFQDETKTELGDEDAFKDQGVGAKTYAAVFAAEITEKPFVAPPPPAGFLPGKPPEGLVITKDAHPLKKGRGTRKLSEITGITLHQTACVLGEKVHRWYNVACHIAITRDGQILFNNDFIKKVWHGNGFNNKTIGFEIDGHFAGLETLDEESGEWTPDMASYWRPKGSDRKPLSITPEQVEACKEAIRWCKRVVDGAGGDLKYLVAHRQSSPSRVSDPGEKTWKLVALPMIEELGMTEGGPDYYILDSKKRAGKPIPEAWNPAHDGVKYRTKTSTSGRKTYGP